MNKIISFCPPLDRAIIIVLLTVIPSTAPAIAQIDTTWVRRYDGNLYLDDYATAMTVDNAGNVYLTGASNGSYGPDIVTIKYFASGDTAWIKRYNGPADSTDRASDIAVDQFGNVYVTGLSYRHSTYRDYLTIKYSPAGDTIWTRSYDGSDDYCDDDFPVAIAADNSGNIYVTGSCIDFDCNRNIVTIKYNSDGDSIWIERYDGEENGNDIARAMVIDGLGNVYIIGSSWSTVTGPDYLTIKYNNDGEIAWVKRYCGPDSLNLGGDYSEAIEVDQFGNVYVTGYSKGIYTNMDCTTIKYLANGDADWVRTFSCDGAHWDGGVDIDIDDSGFVYVFGETYSDSTNRDYLTIKYSGDGDTEWIRIFDGDGNYQDFGRSLAIDQAGNVFVTGSSCVERYDWDYTTVMYYPDGTLGWVVTYDGNRGDDDATEIVLDSMGDIYITGSSIGDNYDYDYATIKYHQTQVGLEETVVSRQYRSINLWQNSPNPFNPTTTIGYSLKESCAISLSVYSLLGQRVATVFEAVQEAGEHSVTWDASVFPSGVYFARLEAGGRSENVKMVLLK